MTELHAVTARLEMLERRTRRLRLSTAAFALSTAALLTMGFVRGATVSDEVRTRQLVVVDAAGRPRVIIGAPVVDNFDRVSPATGMVIRDSVGNERFGVSLDGRGNMGLGLDAPRCTSQPCNTERINLVADAEGGSHIRLLDRHTGVAARIVLDDDDRAYLDFLKVTPDSVRGRRMGLSGDSAFAVSRR